MRKTAFTFIEMVMLIIIIGIISVVIATDMMSSAKSVRLNAAGFKLKSDLIYAQALAVTQQINHGIIFNTSSNTYSVYSQNTTNIEKEPSTTLPFTVDYANDTTFKGMTITATSFGSPTTDRVEFDSLGIPYSDGGVTPLAADGTVTINSSGATSTVTVTKNTGKVN